MELKDFVAKTLTGIVDGLNEVNKRSECEERQYQFYFDRYGDEVRHAPSNIIEFDLLVSLEKAKGVKSGILSVIGGFGAEVGKNDIAANRVKFKVKCERFSK